MYVIKILILKNYFIKNKINFIIVRENVMNLFNLFLNKIKYNFKIDLKNNYIISIK